MPQTKSPIMLAVIAHPDDESFGCGALIASVAAAGGRVIVACASRGELGEDASGLYADAESLGMARENELRSAAELLGVAEVEVLGLVDSGWEGPAAPGSIVAEPARLASLLDEVLRKYRPSLVVGLDPTGSDGHRDHAAVGHAITEAFDRVVDWPASLYHWCLPHSLMDEWTREIAAKNPGQRLSRNRVRAARLGRDNHLGRRRCSRPGLACDRQPSEPGQPV